MGWWNKPRWEDGTNLAGRMEQTSVGTWNKPRWEDETNLSPRMEQTSAGGRNELQREDIHIYRGLVFKTLLPITNQPIVTI